MIYLDYNATTPVDQQVLDVMLPYFSERYGNASSVQHGMGQEAELAVERARQQVATVLGADPREIVFTSGATESNNLGLQGVAKARIYSSRKTIITVNTEHKAVLDLCDNLGKRGYSVTYLDVDSDGMLDLAQLEAQLEAHLDKQTLLVSIMAANNETGVLHPIEEIGQLCRSYGVLFHTDATQAVGRIPVDVQRCAIDLLSLSAHKLYGPKGVGALYVRRKGPRTRCEPLFHGGGHERGFRSGTLNVPGIVGLGEAIELANATMPKEQPRLATLRDSLEHKLQGACSRADIQLTVNGHATHRLSNTTNLTFANLNADQLMAKIPELAVSSSAACTSASRLPSYVLSAMGRSDSAVRGSLRFSLGRFTTEAHINAAATMLESALR